MSCASRFLTHIHRLNDCFGQFLVRVSCACGASRHIEPEALARLVGWSMTLNAEGVANIRQRDVLDGKVIGAYGPRLEWLIACRANC